VRQWSTPYINQGKEGSCRRTANAFQLCTAAHQSMCVLNMYHAFHSTVGCQAPAVYLAAHYYNDGDTCQHRRKLTINSPRSLLCRTLAEAYRPHTLYSQECRDDHVLTVNAAESYGNYLALINDPSHDVPYRVV